MSYWTKTLDRGAVYSLVVQAWMVVSTPITLAVVMHHLSASEQGYYYTFGSVIALQVLAELGLATVVTQIASHEWAFLRRGTGSDVVGPEYHFARLGYLFRFSVRWYAVMTLLLVAGLTFGGYAFFNAQDAGVITWRSPWLALSVAVGLSMVTTPIFALLEGCNEISSVYAFRLIQAVLSSITIVVAICMGAGLFSLSLGATVRLVSGVIFIYRKHGKFLLSIANGPKTARVDWREEIWPFQWRIAISWLSGYITYSILTPIMFYFHGAELAGRMGMTLAVVAVIESVTYPLMATRGPTFGILIAQRRYTELNQMFRRRLIVCLALGCILACGVLASSWILQWKLPEYHSRLLGAAPLILLVIQKLLNLGNSAMAVYLRAHKREPLVIPSVVGALMIGVLSVVLGKRYGATGAAASYFLVTIIWLVPSCLYVFHKARRTWHTPAAVPQ